jgi:hypothetical protein
MSNGCVTTPPLEDCNAKVGKLLKDQLFPAKQCLGIVDQKGLRSSESLPVSGMLIVLCQKTTEYVGIISSQDEKLLQEVKSVPNIQAFGKCTSKEGVYEVFIDSVTQKELKAEK